MIDSQSRYARVGTTALETPDGNRVLYLCRRFLPEGTSIPSVRSVDATAEAERLDLLSTRVLGDPFAFWRLCDANDALNPFDVVDECEGRLRVPSGVQ